MFINNVIKINKFRACLVLDNIYCALGGSAPNVVFETNKTEFDVFGVVAGTPDSDGHVCEGLSTLIVVMCLSSMDEVLIKGC